MARIDEPRVTPRTQPRTQTPQPSTQTARPTTPPRTQAPRQPDRFDGPISLVNRVTNGIKSITDTPGAGRHRQARSGPAAA